MARRRQQQQSRQQSTPVIHHYDRFCLAAVMGLVLLGLLMVASSSIFLADREYNHAFYFLTRQTIFFSLGMLLAMITLRLETDFWFKGSSLMLFVTFLLLIIVLIPGIGYVVNGSRRWIDLGLVRIQVSEIAKLSLIIYLAGYIMRHGQDMRESLIGFVKPLAIVGIAAILLLLEPDFGACVVVTLSAMGMLFVAGVRLNYFIALIFTAGSLLGLIAVMSPYRLARLTTFLDPWSAQFDSGYQLTQSLIAFGRGGYFGVGLGESVQKLFYLPEAHNDFLFAILAEELGLFGTLLVIGLYAVLIFRGFLIARRALIAKLGFGAYLAYGISFYLGAQALINIGVNAGVLPTKGLTLPFMSYGGASMLVNCVAVAMLLRIDYETRRQRFGF